MYIKTLGAVIILASATLPAIAQTPPPPPPPEAKMMAAAYVKASGASDQFEIQSSQIAAAKSTNSAVRRFAAEMIADHNKTTDAATKAAAKAGLPPMPPMLDPGATASINELQTTPPADFDRVYLGQQIPAHQGALEVQTGYAAQGDMPALKMNARKTIPIVQHHLDMALKMQAAMSSKMKAGM